MKQACASECLIAGAVMLLPGSCCNVGEENHISSAITCCNNDEPDMVYTVNVAEHSAP